MIPRCTFSLILWDFVSMFFDRVVGTFSTAIAISAERSTNILIGIGIGMCHSAATCLVHTRVRAASDAAVYSASALDSVTLFCKTSSKILGHQRTKFRSRYAIGACRGTQSNLYRSRPLDWHRSSCVSTDVLHFFRTYTVRGASALRNAEQ